MEKLIAFLGEPAEITVHNSHRWQIGKYLFCVMQRETHKGIIFFYNILDENGISCGGGIQRMAEKVIEGVGFLQNRVKREEKEAREIDSDYI